MSAPVREIGLAEIEPLARGCAILGTGGGGEVYTGSLIVRQAIEELGPVAVVRLDELDPDGILLPLGMIGAPTVAIEKIPSGPDMIAEYLPERDAQQQVGIRWHLLERIAVGEEEQDRARPHGRL